MSAVLEHGLTLRARQQASTREDILDRATDLLLAGEELVSHESIARAGNMSARTVYRHFPDRKALMAALWTRLRATTGAQFPTRAEDIVPFARQAFASLDEHAPLVSAVMASAAGAQLQRPPAEEGARAYANALEPLLCKLPEPERKLILASFLAIYSAAFWQLLHERSGLSGPEAQDAVAWVLGTLLQSLNSNEPATTKSRKRKKK